MTIAEKNDLVTAALAYEQMTGDSAPVLEALCIIPDEWCERVRASMRGGEPMHETFVRLVSGGDL